MERDQGAAGDDGRLEPSGHADVGIPVPREERAGRGGANAAETTPDTTLFMVGEDGGERTRLSFSHRSRQGLVALPAPHAR
jgi:hypothetical protein